MEPQLLLNVCGFLFGVAVTAMIGAGLLNAAIALYNFFAERSQFGATVPELDFSRAALTVLIIIVVNSAISFAIGVVVGPLVNEKLELASNPIAIYSQLGTIVLGFAMMAVILSAMLPTSLPRAALVVLCYLVIVIAVVAGLIAVIAGSWYAFEAFE